MSTAAQVRAAWKAQVFDDSTLQAISEKAFNYDIRLNEDSQKALGKLRHEQRVNFFQYLVSRHAAALEVGATSYRYQVAVSYTLQTDTSGDAYNTCLDAFEAIETRMLSGLGIKWSNTVDISFLATSPPTITEVDIAGVSAWQASQVYFAEKAI